MAILSRIRRSIRSQRSIRMLSKAISVTSQQWKLFWGLSVLKNSSVRRWTSWASSGTITEAAEPMFQGIGPRAFLALGGLRDLDS